MVITNWLAYKCVLIVPSLSLPPSPKLSQVSTCSSNSPLPLSLSSSLSPRPFFVLFGWTHSRNEEASRDVKHIIRDGVEEFPIILLLHGRPFVRPTDSPVKRDSVSQRMTSLDSCLDSPSWFDSV